jgi:hypothetical protein
MLAAETLKTDLVIRKVSADRTDDGKDLYKLTHKLPGEPFWRMLHLATKQQAILREDELGKFEPVSNRVRCDVDFTAIIGSKVTVTTQWGKFSGMVQRVLYIDIDYHGETLHVPRAFVIEGEETAMHNVLAIKVHDA